MRLLREDTRTEREGAYRPKTDSDVKTSVLFFFLRLAICTACQSQKWSRTYLQCIYPTQAPLFHKWVPLVSQDIASARVCRLSYVIL